MDTSFDLVALLKERPVTKTHKVKPTQFVSVAGGVQKRLETNIKLRKSSRLSVFDRIRNIQQCDSPRKPVLSDAQKKAEYRKQQLEKWKEEKEKKKKESAAQKKKPFVTGAPVKLAFGPPPPPKPMPSTSGRVTRSQARQRNEPKPTPQVQSFAPKNARFKPQFEASEMPILAKQPKKKPSTKVNITFEPVPPKPIPKVESSRATRSKAATTKPVESRETRQKNVKTKPPPKNVTSKPPPLRQQMFQSSSSSDMEQQATKSKRNNIRKPQSSSSSDSDGMKKSNISGQRSMFTSSSSSDVDVGPSTDVAMSGQRSMFTSSSSSDVDVGPSTDVAMSGQRSMFTSSSSSDVDVGPSTDVAMSGQRSMFTSSSSSDVDVGPSTDVAMSGQRSMFTSSSRSDVDIGFTTDIAMSNSSSIDSDQQTSKLQDTTSMSEESEKEIEVAHTPKNKKVPKSESSSEEKLRSPNLSLTPEQITEEAKNISPCVTMSRGKSNARLEMKKKLDEGLLDEDNSNRESVEHLRRQMNSETERMTALCEVWDKVFAQTELPDTVQELVLAAVGQARLLMSKKMQQFAGLVEACANPTPGAALITPADLQGFWDMVFMQVENVDMRFKKLDELRASGWVEPQVVPAARKQTARPVAKKPKPAGGPGRLRDMIAAARKAKQQQESQSSSEMENSEPPQECKTFDAGFFSVSSPLKKPVSPAPSTPANKSSLLKSVLSSEARKASASKNSASFAMLRAAKMGKNVDIEGISPLLDTPKPTPLNLYATPARSILKQANPVSAKKPDKIKTVLFHEDDSSPLSYASCDKDEHEGAREVEEVKEVKEAEEVKEVEAVKEVEEVEKENVPRRRRSSRLSRQNAEERPSPILTRSRKSALTPRADNSRASHTNAGDDTPKRTARRRKSAAAV